MIPDEARAPIMKPGCTTIEFSITTDGRTAGLKFASISVNQQLDRAPWLAITNSGAFPALPAQYARPSMALRFHFYYNPFWNALPEKSVSLPARVTTSTTALAGETAVPHAIYAPAASYPRQAFQARKQGEVLLSLLITKKGSVRHVTVLQGLDQDLDTAARKQIGPGNFSQVTRNGKPAEVAVNVKVVFNLK